MSFLFSFRRRHAAFLVATLLGGGILRAAEPAASLTLQDALQRTVNRNATLAASRTDERVAEALIEQAGLRPNPTLDVSLENVMGTGAARGIDQLESTVQASQTLERGHKRSRRVALASSEREAAAKRFLVQRSEILAATVTAFIETVAAERRRALADEPLRLARETVKAVDTRMQAGVTSAAELARSRSTLASAQAEVTRAEVALFSARATLASAWGGDAQEIPSLASVLQIPESLPEPSTALSRLATHPRLDLQQAVIEGRRASLKLEQALAVQDVTVAGGVRFLREGSDAAFVAGVSMPLPLRNKNQGNIRAARETLSGAELAVQAVETALRISFQTAWRELVAAHDALQALRRDALPPAEEAQRIVREAYEQGQLPLLEVLDAQRTLVALQREILDQESAYASAVVQIDALTDPTFAATARLIALP